MAEATSSSRLHPSLQHSTGLQHTCENTPRSRHGSIIIIMNLLMIAILVVVLSQSCRALRAESLSKLSALATTCAVCASRSPLRSVSAVWKHSAAPGRCQAATCVVQVPARAHSRQPESGRAETQPKRLQSFQRLGSGPRSAGPALGEHHTEAWRCLELPPGSGSAAGHGSGGRARPYLPTASSSGCRAAEGLLKRPLSLQGLR